MRPRFRLAPTILAPAILAAALAAWPAHAQVTFTRCLNQAEVLTEQLVRHGIFLREAGNRCDEYKPGTANMWKQFDTNFGARMKQQTEKRKKLFTKQFKGSAAQVNTFFDGRIVTYHRHYPLTMAYCTNVEKMLKEVGKKGWNGFVAQAKTVQNEVILDYKVCQ